MGADRGHVERTAEPRGCRYRRSALCHGRLGQQGALVKTLEIYDPVSNSWDTGATIPKAYGASTGVNLNGKFYVIGGCVAECGTTSVQVYDPETETWSVAANYPEPTSWSACGAISGLIYCAGGNNTP